MKVYLHDFDEWSFSCHRSMYSNMHGRSMASPKTVMTYLLAF